MKRIGILLRDYTSLSHNKILGLRDDLIAFLRKYPVEVICIPVCFKNNEYEELERVKKTIRLCDGIILPGGANCYEIDLKIVKYLYKQDIPTLGICLGMQMMALAFDGKIDYLPNEFHQNKDEYVHPVKMKKGSLLEKIIESDNITVNSRHSEHITKTDLNIVAISNDLIIEAVEDKTKKFFIGVQWHPESLFNDMNSKKIFDYFISSL